MELTLSRDQAPPLGDIRALGEGDALWLKPGWQSREDWTRYLVAAAQAMGRGAQVRQGDGNG
ncbi:hypothetical protein AB0I84_08095 [Streptomyces spectabilis]|uniref:hypothetical protein n=1 Tax=Streptomyces spectabilis TaxID=68270 RepID=UPI0033C68C45